MARSTALYRNKAELQRQLQGLPAAPGIYRFYDAAGALVYVGKSVCLKDRVRSYFTGQAGTKKLRRMRQEISRLEWETTGSELEALLLESRQIKLHQPRFNVMLREFVPLPYVRVDRSDPFPRLEVTRSPGRDGAAYFGPFRSQQALEAGVAALADALQLRDCPGPGALLTKVRPCYRHEFGTCSAPCLGQVEEAEYGAALEQACAVFDGRGHEVVELLQARMERAAELLRFETAARLRDAIRHIQAVGGRQQALLSAIAELSLVAACPARSAERLSLFVFRSGHLVLHEDAPLAELRDHAARECWARRLLAAWQTGESVGPQALGVGKETPGVGCRALGVGEEAPRAQQPARTGPMPNAQRPTRLDSALLDEIQIVSGWMKQRTGEGAYWQIPADAPAEQLPDRLAAWLAGRVDGQPALLAA